MWTDKRRRSRRAAAFELAIDRHVERRKTAALKEKKGWHLLFTCASAHFAHIAKGRKSERIWNADRRSLQPAVLLARPRLQQEAHAYRRSTTVLTQGTRHPKGPASGHASWDVD
jgi:hypothetical protein